jgi:flagellar biosynthesis regulator FlbT
MEKSNEKALKIIEQQYVSFINQQDSWDFFRGLAEYTRTIREMTQSKPFIRALETQREIARKTYEMMNSKAMKELAQSATKLLPIAEKVIKQYEPIIKQTQEIAEKYQPVIRAVQEVHDRMAGRILSSNPLYAFDSDLFDVARHLKASGHEKEVEPFVNNKKKNHNIYGNFTFSPTYEVIDEEERKLERKGQVEPWGAWEHLPLVERLVFEPEELKAEVQAKTQKEVSFHWDWLNFIGVYVEMEKIRKGEKLDNDVVIFKVKDFRSYAQRVHAFITKELIANDSEPTELSFDDQKRTLYFMGVSILISKKEESDPHKLIRTLFKDEHKVWANDEIIEDWGYSFDEEISENKVYQAGKKINKTIAEETKIKDFLDVSTKSVAINKKYLKT